MLNTLTYHLICLAISFSFLPNAITQTILHYGPDAPTANIHYNGFLHGIYKKVYNNFPAHPVKGAYSPTHYANTILGVRPGVGVCNYIYFPTQQALLPGQPYKITLTVLLTEAYGEMPFYQKHFGIALTSDLFENYFGLWNQHFIPLNVNTTEQLVTVDIIFRPLCTSAYLVLGVFQGKEKETKACFACQYGFELHELTVEKWNDPKADFVYLCDAFEEQKLPDNYVTTYDTDTVYFKSGSAQISDPYRRIIQDVPGKLKTKQDLVALYAYTDAVGHENEQLGATRNMAVRDALISAGMDSTRIVMINFGESKASGKIAREERRVEIDVNLGKLFQKYYSEAWQAASLHNYKLAEEKINQWLRIAPPSHTIYALFDCWGNGEKYSVFRERLYQNIKLKTYKSTPLQFTFDSLYCEDQQGRGLSRSVRINHLPGSVDSCSFALDSVRKVSQQTQLIDEIYARYGFPTIDMVGERGNKALPYLILHTNNITFQKRYLPILQKACEDQIISWEFYAMLYDKIAVTQNGRQRYGTQWKINSQGGLSWLYPLEDESMVAEYRKQVGLAPLSDF